MLEQRGLVVHIAQGTFEGTISWIKNPDSDVSSHFVVAKDGSIAQMVDSDTVAWTQRDGNGHWLSVENEGFTPSALTAAQVESNAQLLAYGAKLYKYPLTLAGDPSGKGLGYHSMGAEHGYNWGHSECPGPAIKNQLPAILARAQQIASGGTQDMLVRVTESGAIWTVDPARLWRRYISADEAPTWKGVPTIAIKQAELDAGWWGMNVTLTLGGGGGAGNGELVPHTHDVPASETGGAVASSN